ncbi:MAG: VCBS repeat-containing protein [Nocardioides sp.]
MSRPRRAAAAVTAACLVAVPTAVALSGADAASAPQQAETNTSTTDPVFTRYDVDTALEGASFTTVGEVFAGEQNIVTSSYGPLDDGGRPVGGGGLQVYRPGETLESWTKITLFGPEDGLVFPNATTIEDVDGDGDNDIIVPSGYFFGTDPAGPEELNATGAITWWENHGPDADLTRHDVITDQPGSYHGVQLVDLDGDEILDLVSTVEEARVAGSQTDDSIETQFFKGRSDHTFEAPVALADVGGSQPVVADVDEDGDLDIISSRYFDPLRGSGGGTFPAPAFLWLENGDDDDTLTAADFTVRTIATLSDVGMGFQIRPVPDFREPGTISWIGTNHVNRCTFAVLLPPFAWPEQVIEFIPGDDITEPWERRTLSDPDTPVEPCPADYGSNRDNYPVFSDAITSRYGPGQGAPGVLGYGDIDGDGDLDLAVSGDGDRRLWWIEQHDDGSTQLHQLTSDGEYFGQSGGAAVVDLNGDGVNEMVFSSFDQDAVAVWTPEGTVDLTRTVDSTLTATPAKRTVKAGKKATWKLKLVAAEGGPKRTVKVTFDPKKGKNSTIRTLKLGPADAAKRTGKLTWKPKKSGKLVFVYSGTQVSELLGDTAARDTAKVTVKKNKKKK